MFANDRQASRCCIELLKLVRLGHLWTEEGPTAEAVSILEKGGALSGGEALMLQICFDVWDGAGHATIGRVVEVLDGDRLQAVCTLLVARALGSTAVDAWLEARGA